jgi:hypothetical protein
MALDVQQCGPIIGEVTLQSWLSIGICWTRHWIRQMLVTPDSRPIPSLAKSRQNFFVVRRRCWLLPAKLDRASAILLFLVVAVLSLLRICDRVIAGILCGESCNSCEHPLSKSMYRRPYSKAEYQTPEWRALRASVIVRAGGRCEICHRAIAVQTHHKTYRFGTICPPQYLVGICKACHEKVHGIQSSSNVLAALASRGYYPTENLKNRSSRLTGFPQWLRGILQIFGFRQ